MYLSSTFNLNRYIDEIKTLSNQRKRIHSTTHAPHEEKSISMRILLLNACLILLSHVVVSQTLNSFSCPPTVFQKNKNENPTNSDKEIIIPIQWIEIYQCTKRMTIISSNLGKDIAYMKSKNQKLSFKKYEKQIDSMLLIFQNIKVINETEDLVESEYCYLEYERQNISTMNSLITNNPTSVGIEKILAFIAQQKSVDKLKIGQVNSLLNSMAKKYDLYKYR